MLHNRPVYGLEDVFGVEAKALRRLQFALFALFEESGFSEVIPPFLERQSTLMLGAGKFLADQTLVFTDPADTGQLAIRPDMTPQIARIAATRMCDEAVLKLFYSGTVILARPDSSMAGNAASRQQWQTGVECFGLAGSDGDVEVIRLAAQSMYTAGFHQPVLMIGHMQLLKSLTEGSSLSLEGWVQLMYRRSPEDVQTQLDVDLARGSLSQQQAGALADIVRGMANVEWLQQQKGQINEAFDQSSDELQQLVEITQREMQGKVDICIDIAVMPRFLYHTGMVFSGFSGDASQALLHGGRYDAMMAAHGRDMPATGFSCDLWAWVHALH